MKLNILGASGTGVTTLGKRLSSELNITYFDSDDFFWENSKIPYSVKQNPKNRDKNILEKLNETEKWILGGSVINWSSEIHNQFDTIIFLHIPQKVRLERLRIREYERYGEIIKTDSFWKNRYDNFIKWAKDYDDVKGIANRNIKTHKKWLDKHKSKVINLKGDLSTDERIKIILNEIKTSR